MTLLELTEPIFQYICRLNRLSRKSGGAAKGDTLFITKGSQPKGASLDYGVVRAEIKSLFEDLMQKGGGDIRLAGLVKKKEDRKSVV